MGVLLEDLFRAEAWHNSTFNEQAQPQGCTDVLSGRVHLPAAVEKGISRKISPKLSWRFDNSTTDSKVVRNK